MAAHSLYEIYKRHRSAPKHLFVVPLIRFDLPNTDYLANLYKPLIDKHPEVVIHNTSALNHFSFVWAQITGKAPILHYHWLEFQDFKSLAAIKYKLLCIALFKLFGGKLVWTIHNLTPHNKKWLRVNKWVQRWMAKRSDEILAHTPTAKKLAAQYLNIPESDISVFPHPPFPTHKIKREKALQALSTEFDVSFDSSVTQFLTVGTVSAYKQIPLIVEALQSCSGKWQLIIAGFVKKGQHQEHHRILNLVHKENRIIYLPRFIEEHQYPLLLSAADVCVFNFDAILYSGGVEMARSYDKPIIAPELGGLADLKDDSHVKLFRNQKEFKNLLQEAMNVYPNG